MKAGYISEGNVVPPYSSAYLRVRRRSNVNAFLPYKPANGLDLFDCSKKLDRIKLFGTNIR